MTSRIYWVVGGDYADPADSGGAAAVSGADVLPDLVVHPLDVSLGAAVGATVPITALVENRGNWPNDPTELRVYDRQPDLSGAQVLGSLAVLPIAPGAIVTVTGSLTTAMRQMTTLPGALYLEIDPAQSSGDTNRANNLLVIGKIGEGGAPAPTHRLFLPQVGR
jgi:hypothetical protein